jgi:hypothetical protein
VNVSGDRAAVSARTTAVAELIQGQNVDDSYPNARTWLQSVVDEGFHYIKSGDGREEIYDLSADPEELANLVSSPDHRPSLERLRRLIAPFEPPNGTHMLEGREILDEGGRR